MCIVIGQMLSACDEIVPRSPPHLWHVQCSKHQAPREALVCAIRFMSVWQDLYQQETIENLYEILAKKDSET